MSAIDELSRKFVSGNDVQVERASFTREEWQSVVDERDQLRDALSIAEGLAKQNKEMAEGFIQLRDRVAELEASTAKIKAEAVREAKKNIVIAGMHRGNLYDQGFIDAIDAYNEQMEKYANQLEADNG